MAHGRSRVSRLVTQTPWQSSKPTQISVWQTCRASSLTSGARASQRCEASPTSFTRGASRHPVETRGTPRQCRGYWPAWRKPRQHTGDREGSNASLGFEGGTVMLVIVGTLLGGLACVAVAFEAPLAALGLGSLAYWVLTHTPLPNLSRGANGFPFCPL